MKYISKYVVPINSNQNLYNTEEFNAISPNHPCTDRKSEVINVSPLKHPILSEKSEISRVINGQTLYNDKNIIKPSKRNKNSVKKKGNFLIRDMKNTTLKDLLPKMSTKRSKRRQPRGFSMEDGKFNHNSPTKYNFYPSRRISKLSSADFGSTSKRKYEDRSGEDSNTIFSMRFQTHKGNFRKNKAS